MVISLCVFFLLSSIALLIGNQVLGLFRCQFADPEEELLFSYGLGLVLLSWLVMIVGAAGFLEKKFLWLEITILGISSLSRVPGLWSNMNKKNWPPRKDPPPDWLEIIFWFLIIWIGAGALVPPFGTDAIAYHLSLPQAFLRMRRIDWIPDDVNSLFPFFMGSLFTLALALRDEIVAQLFHWGLGVTLAVSVSGFFSRFFDSRKWGRIAAIFLILTPGIFNEMRTSLVDVGWACYGFMSFYALAVARSHEGKGWPWLSFIFLGATMGVKYLAVLSVSATFCVLMVWAFRSKWTFGKIFGWTLVMGVIGMVVSGYWYFKAYQVHGNPFYPYFNQFFGLKPFLVGTHAPGEYAHKAGMGRSLSSLFLLPFNLTLFPARFDGWREQIGSAYLVFLPFAFRGAWTEIRQGMVIYIAIFTLGWFWLGQVTRFLYPALPFLTLLIVSGIFFYSRNRKPVFIFSLLALVLTINGLILTYHSRESLAYLAGFESKDAFLLKRERSYNIAKFVRENLPKDAKILNCEETRMFYFARNLVREAGYRFRTKYDRTEGLEPVLNRLKEEGFTHLLIADSGKEPEKMGIRKWVGPETHNGRLKRVYRSTFKERDGREIEYALFEIQ